MDAIPGIMQAPASVRQRIYTILYESGAGGEFCSRQTLATRCGISLPTLYQNLNELINQGLVRFTGEEQSTGGRRAQGLDIVPGARISIGISVTEENLRIVATDLRLKEIAYKKLPHKSRGSFTAEVWGIPNALEEFIAEFGLEREKILGVGITIPGMISPDSSRITLAPTLNLRDVPLDDVIKSIPFPVYVDNDGSASGHAESFVRKDTRSMAYLSLENGIGGAVLIGSTPYAGVHARSGEFGHICVEPGGMRCHCGKLGCLEAYCSARRVEEQFGITLEEFFRGVEEHEPEYEALLYDMLRHLAVGINNIHMVLDCDIILGGFFSEYLPPYMPALKRYVLACSALDENADYVDLSKLRRHIAPLGAALYFIREYIGNV